MLKYLVLIFSLFFASFSLSAPVNINNASAQEISKALSGIGDSKAQAIVDYREKHGPFKSVKDLVKVKGIGEKTVEKNKGDIFLEDIKK